MASMKVLLFRETSVQAIVQQIQRLLHLGYQQLKQTRPLRMQPRQHINLLIFLVQQLLQSYHVAL